MFQAPAFQRALFFFPENNGYHIIAGNLRRQPNIICTSINTASTATPPRP